jgi:hypothetical protein
MRRRAFLKAFAALPAITALAGPALCLPKRDLEWFDRNFGHRMAGDFDTANLRYKSTERFSNVLTEASVLSEDALEQLCIDIAKHVDERGVRIAFKPTKVIFPPGFFA